MQIPDKHGSDKIVIFVSFFAILGRPLRKIPITVRGGSAESGRRGGAVGGCIFVIGVSKSCKIAINTGRSGRRLNDGASCASPHIGRQRGAARDQTQVPHPFPGSLAGW